MAKEITGNLDNLLLDADAYKASHYLQYPADTEFVSVYIEPRGGRFKEAIVFGFQAFIKEYLSRPITATDIVEAELVVTAMGLPFNKEGWEYILNKYNGRLPIRIDATPEGLLIPERNVVAVVTNTDPKCYWLPGYIETMFLRCSWYMSTVATLSFKCKQIIRDAMLKSSDTLDGLEYKLHDFGSRGASSKGSSIIGGLAHLVNFTGTDTMNAVVAGSRWYNAKDPVSIIGRSIPAAEHGTITSWGRAGEVDAYKNMLKQFLRAGQAVAVVSDAYDLWNVIANIWGGELRDEIANSGGVVVVRPDSGDPATVICKALDILGDKFGYSVNNKGYRVLPDCIRLIQGDGISYESISLIINAILLAGWSIDNVAFGMGGGLLQDVQRDDIGWCMKVSAANRAGEWIDVYKEPVTGMSKASKRGRLALVYENGTYTTVRVECLGDRQNVLRTIFKDGWLTVDEDFSTVRNRTGLWN